MQTTVPRPDLRNGPSPVTDMMPPQVLPPPRYPEDLVKDLFARPELELRLYDYQAFMDKDGISTGWPRRSRVRMSTSPSSIYRGVFDSLDGPTILYENIMAHGLSASTAWDFLRSESVGATEMYANLQTCPKAWPHWFKNYFMELEKAFGTRGRRPRPKYDRFTQEFDTQVKSGLENLLKQFTYIETLRTRELSSVKNDPDVVLRLVGEGTEDIWDLHQRLVVGWGIIEGAAIAKAKLMDVHPELPKHECYWPTMFRTKQLLWHTTHPIILGLQRSEQVQNEYPHAQVALQAAGEHIQLIMTALDDSMVKGLLCTPAQRKELWARCFRYEKSIMDLLGCALRGGQSTPLPDAQNADSSEWETKYRKMANIMVGEWRP